MVSGSLTQAKRVPPMQKRYSAFDRFEIFTPLDIDVVRTREEMHAAIDAYFDSAAENPVAGLERREISVAACVSVGDKILPAKDDGAYSEDAAYWRDRAKEAKGVWRDMPVSETLPDGFEEPPFGKVNVCGDCTWIDKKGFCEVRPGSYFYRGREGRACLDFSGDTKGRQIEADSLPNVSESCD